MVKRDQSIGNDCRNCAADKKEKRNGTDLPKPLHLFGAARVVAVDGVALPVVDVDLLHAAQHQLQFALVKVVQPLERHHLRRPTHIKSMNKKTNNDQHEHCP